MPQLDSLLRIVVAQGADELRLGSGLPPSMFADGVPKKLTVPATDTATLLELLGELLGAEQRAELDRAGRLEVRHEATGLGAFRVIVLRRGSSPDALDAVVRKAPAGGQPAAPRAAGGASPPPRPVAASPPAASPPAPSREGAAPPPPMSPAGATEAGAALSALLCAAADRGASDLHLADGEPPTVRLDGALAPLDHRLGVPLVDAIAAVLGEDPRARIEGRGSLDLAVDVDGWRRARMNVFRTIGGWAAAVRFLPRAPRALSELGLPADVEELASLPSGLVIVTGATGSGKSTTLAALAAVALRRRSIVLVTLEDPVEYVFEATAGSLVRQRQLGREFPDFPSGLRDALREDPDVVLIGEMRDPDSIALALTAAETGHLVLTSLHARSAASAVDRILDATPGDRQPQVRQQLADALRAVVAQRLLPREGGGRALAAEVLRNVPAVAAGIRDGKISTLRTAMQAGRAAGMITLERSLADLVQRRQVSLEAARQAANDPESLAAQLAGR